MSGTSTPMVWVRPVRRAEAARFGPVAQALRRLFDHAQHFLADQ